MENIEAHASEEALTAIAKKAIERKTGARGLRSIMESMLLDTMFDLPSLDRRRRSRDRPGMSSRDSARPLYIYADRAGDAGASA